MAYPTMRDQTPLYPLLSLSRLRMETDGEGVTTLVAGAGCPLKCRYCLNKRVLAEKQPEWISPETLLERTRIDDLYFQATGGGLCFGGGEALLHVDHIAAFRALIGNRWRITAETALNVPETEVIKAAGCVDSFIADIKTLNADIYKAYTGEDNARVLKNLQTLLRLAGPERLKVRVPLIPGYNNEADRKNSVSVLKSMGCTNFDLFEYTIKKE